MYIKRDYFFKCISVRSPIVSSSIFLDKNGRELILRTMLRDHNGSAGGVEGSTKRTHTGDNPNFFTILLLVNASNGF